MSTLDPGSVQERLLGAALQLMSERSTATVLQRVVDLAAELTGARYGALGVIDRSGHISSFLTTGLTDAERVAIGPLPRGHGILGALITDQKPLRLREITRDPRSVGFPPHHPPMSSFLGVPVEARGEVFGNIYLTGKQGAAEFTDTDQRALVLLASHAGVAIENARLFDANRLRERRLEAARQISTAILEKSDTNEVLNLVAYRAREFASADLVVIATPDGHGDSLVVAAAAGNDSAGLVGITMPIAGSPWEHVARSGMPAFMRSELAGGAFCPPGSPIRDRTGPAMLVPLSAGGPVFGTLNILRWDPAPPFSELDLLPIESLAMQAALALEYGRTQEQLRRLAVLEERERIARELHDGAVQALFAVGMSLEATAAVAEADVSERIASAVGDLDHVVLELRSYIFGLRSDLAARRIEETLRELGRELEEQSGILTIVDVNEEVARTLQVEATDLVQLAREAVSNVARHAQATTCRISLVREQNRAVLEIDDDGQGFDESAQSSGFGLGRLRDRSAMIGGELQVRTAPASGTCIRVLMPL